MTKVSIVIPTRNRPHLVGSAIRSALAQSHPDLEIVVSDNSSDDATAKEAEGFLGDARVRYVRTPSTLPMPGSWDHALAAATGDYVAILTDDSYLLPNCISSALTTLEATKQEVIVWKHAAYFGGDWLEPGRRNMLQIPRVSGKVEVVESGDALRELYGMRLAVSTRIPKGLNSLVARRVFDQVRAEQGVVFLPPCPDYSCAAAVLLTTGSYALADQILYVDGVTPSSIGAVTSFNIGESFQQFASEFEGGEDAISLFGVPTSSSSIALTLETVAAQHPDAGLRVDRGRAVRRIIDRLVKAELNGAAEADRYWEQLTAHLTQSGSSLLAARAQRTYSQIKWRAVGQVRTRSHLGWIERSRRMERRFGDDGRFDTIDEAALTLPS